MIKKIFKNVLCLKLNEWHLLNLTSFEHAFQYKENTLEGLIERNIYFNYQGWHFEDLGQSSDERKIIKGWYGSRENNRNRNKTIQKMDDYFLPFYVENAEEHTETIGVIMDKISILYIKHLHLTEAKDPRADILWDIIEQLINQTQKLYDGIMQGTKRCITIPHLKLYDANHESNSVCV